MRMWYNTFILAKRVMAVPAAGKELTMAPKAKCPISILGRQIA